MVFIDAENTSEMYFYEKDRIASFKSWPFSDKHVCNIQRMAEAGFYWCGTERCNDVACCFLCHKELDGWESTDDPWEEHKKHAPQCPFVKFGRAEKLLTLNELFDLLDIFVGKFRLNMSEKAKKIASEKLNEMREVKRGL